MARTRRRRRYVAVFFVVLAAGACLALGYWQWGRYESMAGTYQNLGYALQWPLFAAFCVYGYRRFVKLEDEQRDAGDSAGGPADGSAAGSADPLGASADTTRSADGRTATGPVGGGEPAHRTGFRAGTGAGAPSAAARVGAVIDRALGRVRPGHEPVTRIPPELLPSRGLGVGESRTVARTDEDRRLDEYNDYLARLDERATKGRGR